MLTELSKATRSEQLDNINEPREQVVEQTSSLNFENNTLTKNTMNSTSSINNKTMESSKNIVGRDTQNDKLSRSKSTSSKSKKNNPSSIVTSSNNNSKADKPKS